MSSKETKSKIVVIDAPVYSMNSISLFFISGIVREVIGVAGTIYLFESKRTIIRFRIFKQSSEMYYKRWKQQIQRRM